MNTADGSKPAAEKAPWTPLNRDDIQGGIQNDVLPRETGGVVGRSRRPDACPPALTSAPKRGTGEARWSERSSRWRWSAPCSRFALVTLAVQARTERLWTLAALMGSGLWLLVLDFV